jgi:hypothetical protein
MEVVQLEATAEQGQLLVELGEHKMPLVLARQEQ